MSEDKPTLDGHPLVYLSAEEQILIAERLASAPYEKRHEALRSLGAFTPGSRYENKPIIRTNFNQPIPEGVQNPYWDIVRRIPGRPYIYGPMIEPDGYWSWTFDAESMIKAMEAGLTRFHLCARYSWAIPTPGDIKWLEDKLMGQHIVEIGAGSGYWAWQITQGGMQIDAYDPKPPGEDNGFNTHQLYHPVKQDDHQVAAGYPDRALMISWPVYGASYAADALKIYQGDTFVYIGEHMSGCCGDDDLFIELEENWELEDYCGAHVVWWGVHDRLEIYRRKSREVVIA
jgi:hypothetical protein